MGTLTLPDVAAPVAAPAAAPAAAVAGERPLVFQARGLTKIYRMGDVEVQALRSVDFDLHEGELLVLLGASGSGKSTLLNILGGLDTATSGTTIFRGRELGALSEKELTQYRRKSVGFVFQFYNLIPSLTARENVELVTDISTNPMPALDALRLVGLADRADHFPAQMSGGEQQRVAIARAIAKRPEVLLCDEPTGALDAETGRIVLAALAEVNVKVGTATALITHNAAIAAMADRVLRMTSGKITEDKRNAQRASVDTLAW